jgi:hypothetical protein
LLIAKYGITSICPIEQEKLCVAGAGGVDAAGAELPQLQNIQQSARAIEIAGYFELLSMAFASKHFNPECKSRQFS